ncbi:MAG TPA: class I SAM-dependent methyltransferase [Candidatus Binatus sp.]|jgi:2-polyprenyl-3-methyl-5-hydroxy-6-metoxy-1,4-benzoquinol methylase|nr:class I SAM-dependent methyltransferase [Candidatus Binatus sp.]
MAAATDHSMPTPERIFGTLNAYQQTAALKTAIELDVFTAIGQGMNTAKALAQKCQASERGMRTLCDFLVINGFLEKRDHSYELTPDAAIFLNKKSPAYLGSAVNFLTLPELMDAFKDLTAIVRNGGSLQGDATTTDPDSPKWVEFARSMAPLQTLAAEGLAEILDADAGAKWKVLDIAAGHGMYGVTIAKHNPNAEIFALDWPRVLEVAENNAQAAGVAGRYHILPGNAFEVEFGKGYDLALLTGFLHHFDPATIEKLLRKIHSALTPSGRVATVEFVPNEDRVSPPTQAAFSMVMLGSTRAGDAYPFSEYERMFRATGFSSNELRRTAGPQSVILSKK